MSLLRQRTTVYLSCFRRCRFFRWPRLDFQLRCRTRRWMSPVSSCHRQLKVALVRMTSDRRLPEAQRRKYKNVLDAIVRMVKEEGILTLWTGVVPTVTRAVAGNIAQLVTYKQSKEFLLKSCGFVEGMNDGIGCHFVASMMSGFVYAFSTTPLDVAKTRMQNMKTINGKPEHRGMIDVWVKVVKNEGFLSLWKGFGPYYFRIAPNTVLLFIFTEQLTLLYKKYVLKDTSAKGGI